MPLTDYEISGPPDLTLAQFRHILADAGSPAAIEAEAMYITLLAEGIRPAVFLAFFRQESHYGTQGVVVTHQTHNPGNVRAPEIPSLFITIVDTPRGKFAKYPDWQAGTTDWAFRMTGPKYAGAGLTTVRTVLPVYAPSGDADNDPTGYAATVLRLIEGWIGSGGTTMAAAKPNVVIRPSPNKNGYGSPHAPIAITLHITEGSGASALSWLTNPASGASANYVNAEDGTLYELVPPTESAWCNGDVQKPNLANPVVAAVVASGHNANTATISVENGGHTSMGKGGSLTTAQIDSLIRLCAWLCQEFHIPPDRDHIIGHYQWNSVTRPNCPGFSPGEWATWVGKIKALVGGTAPPVPPSAMLDPVVTPAQDWGGKGRIVAQEVTVENTSTHKFYSRKKTGDVLENWREV